jgi:hypothetical protein
MEEFQRLRGPTPPAEADADQPSFSSLQKRDEEDRGFRIPEAELRQTWDSTSDGRPVKARQFPGSQMFMPILTSAHRFTAIPVPALVILAIPHLQENWMARSTDPAVREAARAYFTAVDALTEEQAQALEGGVPTARVVRLPGAHYIFLSNEGDVIREMRAFVAGLKRSSGAP